MEEIYLKLKEDFERNKDKEKAFQFQKYMRNKFKFYGIQASERKNFYKEFLKEEIKNKKINWKLLDKCYTDDYREFQYFVIDYLLKMQKYLTYEDITHIKKYLKLKQWWDSIDGFYRIIGDIKFKDKRIDRLMLQWSRDEDFWIRRIAINHQLYRKDKTDTELLEKILLNNFGSEEFFINKAIGWSLRNYSKTNPTWVKNFIEKYRDRMNKLSVREANKYL